MSQQLNKTTPKTKPITSKGNTNKIGQIPIVKTFYQIISLRQKPTNELKFSDLNKTRATQILITL